MHRTLIVLCGPIDEDSVRVRCEHAAIERGEVAVCHVLPEGSDALADALGAQRAITAALRKTIGPRAESVAVFTASAREGDRVEDYARAWGATVVRR